MSQFGKIFSFCFMMLIVADSSYAQITPELLSNSYDRERIDEVIAANATRPKLVFDLLQARAEQQIDAGNLHGAATTVATSAAFAVRFPEEIQTDLAILYFRAAELFRQAAQPAAALEQVYAALDWLRQAGANIDLMKTALRMAEELETELGNSERATQLQELADNLQPPTSTPPPNRSDDPGFVSIDVYYATDRERSGAQMPASFYGAGRASELDLGVTTVTVPKTHQPGSIASPSVWRLEFYSDPVKHMLVQSITPLAASEFFASMRAGLAARDSRDAFIFVHGYNVSFDAAAKRTAQLAFDMNFNGLPILYSWPSRGSTMGYMSDAAVVRVSGRRLKHFLEAVLSKSGATTVHLIAHSMGNRAVTDALELIAAGREETEAALFDQIIFAAPDVDKDLFGEMINSIKILAKRLTLYASEEDWALEASRQLHGNSPRAGQGGEGIFSHAAVDTIDMTGLGEDMLAHSYVANDLSALLDISTLFWRDAPPRLRCGLTPRAEATQVWDYADSDCASASLLNVIGSLRNANAMTPDEILTTLREEFGELPQLAEIEAILLSIASTQN